MGRAGLSGKYKCVENFHPLMWHTSFSPTEGNLIFEAENPLSRICFATT